MRKMRFLYVVTSVGQKNKRAICLTTPGINYRSIEGLRKKARDFRDGRKVFKKPANSSVVWIFYV